MEESGYQTQQEIRKNSFKFQLLLHIIRTALQTSPLQFQETI